MRFKLFIGIFTNILFFVATAAYAEKNPLSAFSPKWENKSFNKANTAALNKYLSPLEKEFLQIINLARLSPSLFRQTVLNPYFKNHAYSEAANIVISKMIAQNNSSMLYPSTPLIKQAKSIINNNDAVDAENILTLLPENRKGTIANLNAHNAVEMLLELFTSTGEHGFLFRNYFSGIDNQAGVSIDENKMGSYIVTILFDEFTFNASPFKSINLINHPDDSILNFFINKPVNKNLANRLEDTVYFNEKSVFMDSKDIKELKNNLISNEISYKTNEFTYYINATKTLQDRAANLLSENEYNFSSFHFSSHVNDIEADSAFDYYFIGRTTEPDESTVKVNIIHLTADAPSPAFPEDSIGIFDGATNFSKVDSLVNKLGIVDESKLGIILTKPWKSELEKVRAIFYWMHKNIQYDYVGLALNQRTYEVPDVLKKRVGVCEGYANLFNHLCEQSGIQSIKIHGTTPLGGHAWNAVRINKKWYLMDVTWGEDYFLVNPVKCISNHYPAMRKWSLLTNPPTLKAWRETYLEKKSTNRVNY